MEEKAKNEEGRRKDYYLFLEEKPKKKRSNFRWSGNRYLQMPADIYRTF